MSEWAGWAATRGNRRIGILATPDEAEQIRSMVTDSSCDCVTVMPEQLGVGIGHGSLAAAIVSGELLPLLDLTPVKRAIDDQPPWSDFPFIILLDRVRFENFEAVLEELGNVAIVEPPLSAPILSNAISAALRSRARQREAETYLLQREVAEEHLRQVTMTLEMRVRERMSELRHAHDRLLKEVEERKAAEAALRDSEELYRHTVELSNLLVWTAQPDGRIDSVSPRFAQLTGVTLADALRNRWMDAVHPEDRMGLLKQWAEAVAARRSATAEFRFRMKDGSYRVFYARAEPKLDFAGNVVRWYGTSEDIHDKKQAEERLRDSEERYRLAARATNDVVWDLDLVAGEMLWRDSEASTFGYDVADVPVRYEWWLDRLHPEDRPRVNVSFQRAVAGAGNRWFATYRFQTVRGDYADVYDRGYIIRDNRGKAVRAVGALTNVTERNRTETELRRVQAELIHVSRVSAMGAMASTLAHELNQPLTAVTSYIRGCRRLLESVADPTVDQVRSALEVAESGALRAGQIVRRLRELVARGNVIVRTEPLATLIDEACVIAFVDAHVLGVTHHVCMAQSAAWVNVDRIQIQQVLINLIRNAVQAMQDAANRHVMIAASATSPDFVEVSVTDSGCGLSQEARDALFAPFRTSKTEGMGIGLSISRTIVEAHSGKIWAKDAEGGGTSFHFTIPAAAAPEEAGKASAA